MTQLCPWLVTPSRTQQAQDASAHTNSSRAAPLVSGSPYATGSGPQGSNAAASGGGTSALDAAALLFGGGGGDALPADLLNQEELSFLLADLSEAPAPPAAPAAAAAAAPDAGHLSAGAAGSGAGGSGGSGLADPSVLLGGGEALDRTDLLDQDDFSFLLADLGGGASPVPGPAPAGGPDFAHLLARSPR